MMEKTSNRAVSDVLAFTIVFSIIITSVTLTYTIGFGALNDAQAGEQSQNAERAISALGTNFEDVERGEAESRSGQIALRGAGIDVANDSTINVTVVDGGGSETIERPLRSLTYTTDDTELAYQGGGVFRSDDGNSVTVSEPRVRCGEDRAVVTVVQLQSTESGISGETSVEVEARAVGGGPSLVYPNESRDASADRVTLELDGTRHGEAWDRYLTEDDNEWSESGGTYTCDFGGSGSTGQVYVRLVTIRIDFV